MSVRCYIAVIQDERGYPGPDDSLDPAPPAGPKPPAVVRVVKYDDYAALRGAVEQFLRSWWEFDGLDRQAHFNAVAECVEALDGAYQLAAAMGEERTP